MTLAVRVRQGAMLTVLGATLIGCATMSARWYVAADFDTRPYRTYDWERAASAATGDPRLDNNPFVHDRIRAAVEQRLNAAGFERDPLTNPDLLVHYHVSMTQRIDVIEVDHRRGYGSDARIEPAVYERGTLVVDFVDGRSGTIVWRGWVEDFIGPAIDDQRGMERQIDRAVGTLLRPVRRRALE